MIRYIMSTYFAMGVIGNLCNCIVFGKQSHHHQTSCSVYLLAVSIFSIIYLVWSVTQLLYTLDHIDPQIQSLVYCKMRLYGSHVTGQIVRYLIVLACIDRYCITKASVRIRSWSSVQMARKLILIMCLVWIVMGLHILIFMDIRSSVCSMFDFYKFFYAVYLCIVVSVLPHALMIIFGFLTIRNLHQRHTSHVHLRQKDRDLMRMLVAEVTISLFTVMPYSVNLLYSIATFNVVDKSAERLETEGFISFLGQFIITAHGVASFYVFIISSKPYRHEFTNIIMDWWYKYILRRARVIPFNQ
jgi:hypothetical protein